MNGPEQVDLVGSLRSAGTADSTGTFTLDLSAALRKMGQYQLPHPRLYPLPLISSALACGATRIDVECDLDDFTMSFDGHSYSADALRELPAAFLEAGPEPDAVGRRFLAMAVLAMLALEPQWVRIDTWAHGEGTRLMLDRDHNLLLPLPDPPSGRGVRVHLRESVSLASLARTFAGSSIFHTHTAASGEGPPALWVPLPRLMCRPEEEVLRSSAALAPAAVPIRVNGRRVNPPIDLGACLALGIVNGNIAPRDGFELGPSSAPIQDVRASCEPFSLAVAVGGVWPRFPGAPRSAAFVVGGVTYFTQAVNLGDVNARALVACPLLERDLSLGRLLDGEALQAIWTTVRDETLILMERICDGLSELCAEDAEARQVVGRLASLQRQSGRPLKSAAAYGELLENSGDGVPATEIRRTSLNLAGAWNVLGRYESSIKLAAGLEPVIPREMRELLMMATDPESTRRTLSETVESFRREGHPALPLARSRLGVVCLMLGREEEAEECCRAAVCCPRSEYDAHSQLHNAAMVFAARGAHCWGLDVVREALVRARSRGSNDLLLATAYKCSALVHHEAGLPEVSRQHARSAVEILHALGHAEVVGALILQAVVDLEAERRVPGELQVFLEEALIVCQSFYGPRHPHTADLAVLRGIVALMARCPSRAETEFDKAWQLRGALYGERAVPTASALELLSLALCEAGKLDEGRRRWGQALEILQGRAAAAHRLEVSRGMWWQDTSEVADIPLFVRCLPVARAMVEHLRGLAEDAEGETVRPRQWSTALFLARESELTERPRRRLEPLNRILLPVERPRERDHYGSWGLWIESSRARAAVVEDREGASIAVRRAGVGKRIELHYRYLCLAQGQRMRVTMWLRAEPARGARLVVNHRDPPWTCYASQEIEMGNEWKEHEAEVTVTQDDDHAGLYLEVMDTPTGRVWVRDVSLHCAEEGHH